MRDIDTLTSRRWGFATGFTSIRRLRRRVPLERSCRNGVKEGLEGRAPSVFSAVLQNISMAEMQGKDINCRERLPRGTTYHGMILSKSHVATSDAE